MCEVNRQQRNSLDKKNLVFFFQCRPSLTTDITTNWLHFTFFCPYRNPKHESSFSRNKHTQKVKVDTKNKIWWTSMPPSDSNYNNFVLGVRSHNSKSPSFRKKGRPLSLQKQGFHGEPSVKDTLKKKTRQRGGRVISGDKKKTPTTTNYICCWWRRGEHAVFFVLTFLPTRFFILFQTFECGGVEFGHLVQLGLQDGVLIEKRWEK